MHTRRSLRNSTSPINTIILNISYAVSDQLLSGNPIKLDLSVDFKTTASSVPIYEYHFSDFIIDLRTYDESSNEEIKKINLKDLLHSRWEEAKSTGAINYGLNIMYKLLDGQYNLSMQLNVERGVLRRKPMRFKDIKEPFNQFRWNFTKLHENEILLYLRCKDHPITQDALDRHVIAVNASPLERDHSLIIPSMNKCLPQILTPTAIRIATDVMLLTTDHSVNVLFNSLLGHASVNHLHLHFLRWPYESDLVNRVSDDHFLMTVYYSEFYLLNPYLEAVDEKEMYTIVSDRRIALYLH
ncbi:hypothetical protein DICVIV_00038 [Dictyocaulus viviparus]|uniref:GDPGP1-like N-terminal domain-containing protein n=1 Tax=Dictyocaulus viviparus TaxID=29172 RepID=A0A0D8YA24_DICVI|nr:hypothetical protein DICVIV_00038 [Dictyocaulus viviparus]